MTTEKKQDEKILLAIAAVIAIALIIFGVLAVLSINKKFQIGESKLRDMSELDGKSRAEGAKELLSKAPSWSGAKIRGRNVDLVTSIPVFKIPGHPELVDLYAESGAPVHPPVPNRWWLNNGIDPSYKNSPQRDPDKDGFTNREEFDAKTNPSDPKSHPKLIDKLRIVKADSEPFKIVFTSELGENQNQFRYFDRAVSRSGVRSKWIAQGADIFEDGKLKGRFKLEKIEERKEEKNGYERSVKYAVINDLFTGRTIELARGNKDFEGVDYLVSFKLEALGKGKEIFTLPENKKFDLPSGKESKDGSYHFKEVKGNDAIILYKDGDENKELLLNLN